MRIPSDFFRQSGPKVCSFGVFLAVFGIFAYRGWYARNRLMYLDEIFLGEALRPSVPYFRGFTNVFGENIFLQPFSGYLHTVVRAMTELILLGPLTSFPRWTFLFASVVWSVSAWMLFLAVRNLVDSVTAILVSLSFALLHGSNLILLGQLNAVQWPMLVACIITIVLEYRPRTRVGSVAYPLFLLATSLNSALAFIPIVLLGWRVLALPRRKQWRDAVHFVVMAVPFTLQLLTYSAQQIRTIDGRNPWSYMWREIAYIPTLLLPGTFRGQTQDALSTWANLLLLIFLTVLVTTVVAGATTNFRLNSGRLRLSTELVTVTILVAIVSVYFNGNLNHHYVLVPFTLVWTVVIISTRDLLNHPSMRPWGQGAAISAVFIFVFSSVGLWKSDFRDPFFTPTSGVILDDAVKSAQQACIDRSSEAEVNLVGTGLVLPCEIVMTLR